jgi:hypothetical protein
MLVRLRATPQGVAIGLPRLVASVAGLLSRIMPSLPRVFLLEGRTMIPIKSIPDKKRPIELAKPPRYPLRLYIDQMELGFTGSSLPLLLPEFFDPAFLRFQDNIPVYCTEICVELMQVDVAGLGKVDALCDLYLLIEEFPEGRRPLTD